VTIKIWDDQGVEEDRTRLEKSQIRRAGCREKMAIELKEVIEKATTKKDIIVKGAKGTGRKNEW
jgi:hypothetical protein